MSKPGSRYNPIIQRAAAKRPIDKQLINISQYVTTTATNTTLYTATYPGTITGIRWDLQCIGIVNSLNQGRWFIAHTRDGYTPNAPSLTGGSSLYQPETDVLAFGALLNYPDATVGVDTPITISGSTKTMRKLQAGDRLDFVSLGSVANSMFMAGTIQFFIKT